MAAAAAVSCNRLTARRLSAALQKVAFYIVKDGLSACKRPPFATPFAAFWKSCSREALNKERFVS